MRKPTPEQIATEQSILKIFAGSYFKYAMIDHQGQPCYCLHFTMIPLPGYINERETVFYVNEPGKIIDIKITQNEIPAKWL